MQRILVVDDDAAIRESIRLALDTVGIKTVLADCGERAAAACGETEFDAAIVDLIMPGMDGLETVRLLRDRVPGLPIILVSGSLMKGDDRGSTLLRIADDLPGVTKLSKPFKVSDLLGVVRHCLGGADPAPRKTASA